MEENKVNSAEPMNTGVRGDVPAKISAWTKVKKFLCQEVTIPLTPKQEKVFQEVHDFWHQDVTWKGFKEFWLQEIEITV